MCVCWGPYQSRGWSRSDSGGCREAPAGVQPLGSAPPGSGVAALEGTWRTACRTLLVAPGHHRRLSAPKHGRLSPTAEQIIHMTAQQTVQHTPEHSTTQLKRQTRYSSTDSTAHTWRQCNTAEETDKIQLNRQYSTRLKTVQHSWRDRQDTAQQTVQTHLKTVQHSWRDRQDTAQQTVQHTPEDSATQPKRQDTAQHIPHSSTDTTTFSSKGNTTHSYTQYNRSTVQSIKHTLQQTIQPALNRQYDTQLNRHTTNTQTDSTIHSKGKQTV